MLPPLAMLLRRTPPLPPTPAPMLLHLPLTVALPLTVVLLPPMVLRM
jgi:hypothetical protein